MKRISVLIPMLNEAANLPQLVANLQRLQRVPDEVIVADAGSQDQSVAIATALGLTVVTAARGRATQMNSAARQAKGEWLLFLHADTQLPPDALLQIAALPQDVAWGRFDLCLDDGRWVFRLIARLINLRSRYTGIATGDQAIFIRRALFEQLGGYAEQPLMEDIELCKQLKQRGLRPHCLSAQVVTSARRWQQHGVGRTILLMWRLRFLYWLGVPAQRLANAYRQGE